MFRVVDFTRLLKRLDPLDLNKGDEGKGENNLYLVEQRKNRGSMPEEAGSSLKYIVDTSHFEVSTD